MDWETRERITTKQVLFNIALFVTVVLAVVFTRKAIDNYNLEHHAHYEQAFEMAIDEVPVQVRIAMNDDQFNELVWYYIHQIESEGQ